jgi:hypothetical protein
MALTAITGTTKSGSQKTARQRAFSAKELIADSSAVMCPPDALKSVELKIEGVNDEGAFGTNTMGQKISGKLILYAGDAKIRTFAHELVTKTITYVNITTNSGMNYVFQSADTNPVVSFAYDTDNNLADPTDKPVYLTLLITGYRDNLVIS